MVNAARGLGARRRQARGALLLAGLFVAGACAGSAPEPDAGSAPERDAGSAPERDAGSAPCPRPPGPRLDVAYLSVPSVPARFTSLDVYPPDSGCPAPVVVWVHGGGWVAGDKRNRLAGKRALARAQGWLLVSVNYRLSDFEELEPVRYPVHNEDVAAAVGWVRRHIAAYGGDPSRVALLGHSAGAQIVASVGTDERYLAAQGLRLADLRCVGALDTEGFDVAASARRSRRYRAVFGDDPETWRDASPLDHVARGKGIPSFLVLERGTRARRQSQRAFATALRETAVDVSVVDASALSHAQVNTAIGRPGDTVVTPALVAFLERCFEA